MTSNKMPPLFKMKPILTYKVEKLIPHYKLGLPEGYYIAVPDKGYKDNPIKAIYIDKAMVIKDWHKPFNNMFRRFHDLYGRTSYTLAYFKWEPTENAEPKYIVNEKTHTIKIVY